MKRRFDSNMKYIFLERVFIFGATTIIAPFYLFEKWKEERMCIVWNMHNGIYENSIPKWHGAKFEWPFVHQFIRDKNGSSRKSTLFNPDIINYIVAQKHQIAFIQLMWCKIHSYTCTAWCTNQYRWTTKSLILTNQIWYLTRSIFYFLCHLAGVLHAKISLFCRNINIEYWKVPYFSFLRTSLTDYKCLILQRFSKNYKLN